MNNFDDIKQKILQKYIFIKNIIDNNDNLVIKVIALNDNCKKVLKIRKTEPSKIKCFIIKQYNFLNKLKLAYDYYYNFYLCNIGWVNYLEIDYLGRDLEYLVSNNKIIITKELLLLILQKVRDIHALGIIHNDIKPSNICYSNKCSVNIIDFGISKVYKDNNKSYQISYKYASLNKLKHYSCNFADDLESLIYTFYFLINKKQLFKTIKINKKDSYISLKENFIYKSGYNMYSETIQKLINFKDKEDVNGMYCLMENFINNVGN